MKVRSKLTRLGVVGALVAGTVTASLFTSGVANAYLGPPTAVIANHDYPVVNDFTGDGNADPTVVRLDSPPTHGQLQWWIMGVNGGAGIDFGLPGDIPASANWCNFGGDCNKDDIAVFRPGNGHWYIRTWAGTTLEYAWGTAGDYPMPMQLGATKFELNYAWLTVYRPSNNTVYVYNRGVQQYPAGNTTPLSGGYQINALSRFASCNFSTFGAITVGAIQSNCTEPQGAQSEIYQNTVGHAYCTANGTTCATTSYGLVGDYAFQWDWGMNYTDVGCSGTSGYTVFNNAKTTSVIRGLNTSSWTWYIRNAGTNTVNKTLTLGNSHDLPVPGHFYLGYQLGAGNPLAYQCNANNYNAQTNIAVWDTTSGFWSIMNNAGIVTSFQWGLAWH